MFTLKNIATAVILGGAVLSATAPVALAQNDPTQGRIQRVQAENRAEYFKCAEFALIVYRGALEQAGADTNRVRAARAHYQDNMGRCRNLL